MSEGEKPPAKLAIVQGGRVALVSDGSGQSLPELPGWDGQAWKYRAALTAARAAGHAVDRLLDLPVTHLTPLRFASDSQAPVNMVETLRPVTWSDAWWSPGDEPPLGVDEATVSALATALSGEAAGSGWPFFTRPGATEAIARLASDEPSLAGRFSVEGSPGSLEQVQGWSLSSVWRDDDVVLKVTNPLWPAEPAVTGLLSDLVPDVVPEVLGRGTLVVDSGAEVPYMVQRRVVEPTEVDEADERAVFDRTLAALEALGTVQRACVGHEQELIAAGVVDRGPAATSAQLDDLFAAVAPRLEEEERAKLPGLGARVREILADLADLPPVLVHGDPHLGNVLADSAGSPMIIDWTDAALAWPGVDAFIPIPREMTEELRQRLFEGYIAALGPRHELGVRLGFKVAPIYHAISYLQIGRALPTELIGPFGGSATWFVRRQLQMLGL